MAENIKNPSVTEEALALQTDASGYIVSISGHQIAGGSGGGGTTYIGRNGVNVNAGFIELTQSAYNAVTSVPVITADVATLKNSKLDKSQYALDSATFLTQEDLSNYYQKTETSSKTELETEFAKYTYLSTFNNGMNTLTNQIKQKQDKLTFGYDIKNSISSINGSALAGGSGDVSGNYKAGTDILILDEYSTIQINTNGTANSAGRAFVEGSDNIASGVASHAEGKLTSAMSDYSHTEGYRNIDYEIPNQIGSNHTEGAYNNVSGVYTHVEGHANGASGYGLHVQGGYNLFAIHNMSANKSDPDGRWNIWGISIEGMANATTAEPYSGTIGEPDFGYIHGGILKVIGNGTRIKTDESDPSSEIITRSDALIIYRDGCISAAGKISANGIELGAGGVTSYQGRSGVNVNGGYIELTTTAYNAVTSVSNISNDVNTLKSASANWNKVSDKLDTTAFSTVSGNFLTKSSADNDYAPKSVTADVNTLTAASAGWNNKVDKPTSLVNKYLVLRTDNAGEVSGWYDLTDEYYNKRQINDTFVATAFIDTTTLSGFGKSSNKKLGVNTDVIATIDYVSGNYLPTSGGTVSGQLVVSGGSNYDQENLKFIRTGQNGYGRIGLASNGALAVKVDDNNSNTTQINVAANASYNELIQVQHAGTTAYLIPAVTATTTAGLTNDGILHIILES